jgi:hypothetical protein
MPRKAAVGQVLPRYRASAHLAFPQPGARFFRSFSRLFCFWHRIDGRRETSSNLPHAFTPELGAFVPAARWRHRLKDLAVGRWYLNRHEATFAAPYRVEGYAHASRERFGVMAGSLLSHEAGSMDRTLSC